MSVVYLVGFLAALTGRMPSAWFTEDCFIVWALFSIADALWVRGR